jgi:hypothetical protein
MLLSLITMAFQPMVLPGVVFRVKSPTIGTHNLLSDHNSGLVSNSISFTGYFFKLADSSANGYTHGYAPSIVKENNVYHAFYCSSAELGAGLDAIRYIKSADGFDWSKPKIVLRAKPTTIPATGKKINGAACDPSIVYYDGYYYLFYTNVYQTAPKVRTDLSFRATASSYQNGISVARSRQIEGSYLTYTMRDTWEYNPGDVKTLISPLVERYRHPGSYGAGQQTIVAKDGKLYMWYTDDSVNPGHGRASTDTYFSQSNNPLDWVTKPIKTNIASIAGLNSFDIKYDLKNKHFILIGIRNQHSLHSFLVKSESVDGITWSSPKTIISEQNFPKFAHNNGVSGDRQGYLIDNEEPIVGFGAPYNLQMRNKWGLWDLFGVRVKISNN